MNLINKFKYNKKFLNYINHNLIWHPFTQTKDYENLDMPIITKSKGIKIFDIDGNYYYDTISSWWTNSIGHRNKVLIKSIKKQLNKLDHIIFAGITHIPAIELCNNLSKILPENLNKFFFSDNGSISVEVAIKMAFQYWYNIGKTKNKFLYFENSYHGDTVGSISVGGIDLYHQIFKPLMFEGIKVKAPNCSECEFKKCEFSENAEFINCSLECFNDFQINIEKHKESIAAVIIEPLIQCAAGMKTYPKEFLRKLREKTKEYDILLILDEVATGFGRTGKMFAFEHCNIIPDILCLSKALGGGILPLGLTITNENIYNAFYGDYFSNKTFFHGHSYTAYPLACEVANSHLNYLIKNKLPYSQIPTFEYFHQKLNIFKEWDKIGDVRFIGCIGAIDIVKSRKNKIYYELNERIGFKIYLEGLKNHLILRPLGNTIYWFFPLTIKKSEIDKIFNLSIKTLKKVLYE